MGERAERKTVSITIDGLVVSAPLRAPLIEVTRRLGVAIPTLCHHEALEPAGACRLCTVELVRDGWSRFVTACNFPVEDGMVFRTSSEPVLRWRRLTVEALLARCPSVPAIRELARKAGIEGSRFPAKDDTCILCGLCTRVCQTYSTSAIAMLHRGEKKEIGGFAKGPPEDCVGCGGCVDVCPTGHIRAERAGGAYRVWQTEHVLAVCGVDAARCRACGACEEACPFSIPRVVVRRGGASAAVIDREACRGCGVCRAACPTGAIEQPRAVRALPAKGRGVLAIACPRSGLGRRGFPPVPDGVTAIEVPCAGGVGPAMILGALARGFDGVLVMGRHQETCRLVGAEDRVRDLASRMEELARRVGIGEGRVRFVEPAPGRDGPTGAIADFRASLAPTPLRETIPAESPAETADDALAAVGWVAARLGHAVGAAELDLLIGEWIAPLVLAEAGIGAGEDLGIKLAIDAAEKRALDARLAAAASAGAKTIAARGLAELVQLAIAQRRGSWRPSHVKPVTP
jgi:bidirectional [NiFe] hydrogenase diaphorase subunit